jgi:uncharacterized membrane protein
MSRRDNLFFRPFTLLYFALLALLLVIIIPISLIIFRQLLVRGLGIPPELVGLILVVSLIGSYINIPITTIKSIGPIYTIEEIRRWGVTWRLPVVKKGVRETLITINIGGAILPIALSSYLLFISLPKCSLNHIISYLKTFIVLLIVIYTTNKTSRAVKGMGIATPALGPPIITTIATILVDLISPLHCPTQIAYVGGTLGTLIGADLLNLQKIPELGAPVVSIGGAGTFDGIYITGLISVLLVILLI